MYSFSSAYSHLFLAVRRRAQHARGIQAGLFLAAFAQPAVCDRWRAGTFVSMTFFVSPHITILHVKYPQYFLPHVTETVAALTRLAYFDANILSPISVITEPSTGRLTHSRCPPRSRRPRRARRWRRASRSPRSRRSRRRRHRASCARSRASCRVRTDSTLIHEQSVLYMVTIWPLHIWRISISGFRYVTFSPLIG
jgi:hypothetical protein